MLQFRSINCNFLHFLAITCNSVQLLAILCNNLQFRAIAFNFLQYLAEYCATSCNLVITCNYILLFASSRSWILLNLVLIRNICIWPNETKCLLKYLFSHRNLILCSDPIVMFISEFKVVMCPRFSQNTVSI